MLCDTAAIKTVPEPSEAIPMKQRSVPPRHGPRVSIDQDRASRRGSALADVRGHSRRRTSTTTRRLRCRWVRVRSVFRAFRHDGPRPPSPLRAPAERAQGSLFDTGSDEDHHKASAITPASKGVCVRQDKDQGVLYMVQRAAVRSDVERAAPRCGTSTEPPAEPRRP